MEYISKNWGFNDYQERVLNPVQFPNIVYGDGFIGCNISRSQPMTKLFEGIDGLRFDGCNLTNVDVWNNPTWIINWENCSYVQNEYDFTGDLDTTPLHLRGL